MLINDYYRRWKKEIEKEEYEKRLEKGKRLTEADKFTKAVNNTIDASQFAAYGEMMLRRYNQAEAKRIAKEIDREIMELGDCFVNIKVRKVSLPDDYVKVMEDGVKIVEALKESKKEIEDLREEISNLKGRVGKVEWNEFLNKMNVKDLENKVAKLEGDLEYAKCSGWLDRFVYPVTTIEYPIMTYSNVNPFVGDTVTIEDIFKSVT